MNGQPERSLNPEDYQVRDRHDPNAEDRAFERAREKQIAEFNRIISDPAEVRILYEQAMENDAFCALLCSKVKDNPDSPESEWADPSLEEIKLIRHLAKAKADFI